MKSTSKMRLLSCFVLALLLGIFIADAALAKTISVDRVRWKYNWCCWTDHDEYPEWKNEGIWTEYRKKTYIGKYWQPAKSSVRNMVIVIAGQQGSSGSSGCSNCPPHATDRARHKPKKSPMRSSKRLTIEIVMFSSNPPWLSDYYGVGLPRGLRSTI